LADIINELESIELFVSDIHAFSRIRLQNVAKEPENNELSIRFVNADGETETGYHYRLDHDFQFIYFAKNPLDCLQVINVFEKAFNDNQLIPIKDSLRYLRINGFGTSAPFENETGLQTVIGMLSVSIREARTQTEYEKVMQVNARYI
jgi:hypothetical protein